jgi:hypothetical protein
VTSGKLAVFFGLLAGELLARVVLVILIETQVSNFIGISIKIWIEYKNEIIIGKEAQTK